jgi:hypothetical protein
MIRGEIDCAGKENSHGSVVRPFADLKHGKNLLSSSHLYMLLDIYTYISANFPALPLFKLQTHSSRSPDQLKMC